jgi:hypothetical protein
MSAPLVIQDPLQVFQVDDRSFPCLQKCRQSFFYDEAGHPLYRTKGRKEEPDSLLNRARDQ